MNGPGQGNPSPLTVTSPDLAGGTFPREFTCDGANRPPRLQWSTPPSGTQELAVQMPGPRRAGRHLHPVAHLPDAPWHHQPGGRAARRRGRRQRLRPARLRGPMPAARRRASLPLRGPRTGHLAGPGSRSEAVGSGLPRQRSRAGQGRTGRHLPARLSGPCQRQRARFGQQERGPSLSSDADHRVQSTSRWQARVTADMHPLLADWLAGMWDTELDALYSTAARVSGCSRPCPGSPSSP